MRNDARFNYWFIGSTTFLFVAIMLLYHHQQKTKIESLQTKLSQVTEQLEQATELALANQSQTQEKTDEEAQEQQKTEAATATGTVDQTKEATSHIAQLDRDIVALESRMSTLNQTKQSIDDHAVTNEKQQSATVETQKAEFDNRIATLMQEIGEVDQKLKLMQEQSNTVPPEIPMRDLREQRVQLQNELERLNAAKAQLAAAGQVANSQTSNAATAERDRVRQEQEDIKRRITELQTERENWVKKQSANSLAQ